MKRLELIEIPGHVGLLALGQTWMTTEHYADLVTACYLGYDLSENTDPEIHELAAKGIALLEKNNGEFEEMRHIVGTVVQWVAKQPNVKIYNATVKRLRQLDEQERLLGNGAADHL